MPQLGGLCFRGLLLLLRRHVVANSFPARVRANVACLLVPYMPLAFIFCGVFAFCSTAAARTTGCARTQFLEIMITRIEYQGPTLRRRVVLFKSKTPVLDLHTKRWPGERAAAPPAARCSRSSLLLINTADAAIGCAALGLAAYLRQ